ncbi:MAG: polysaccharide biosynthesis protein [Clostridia bacterium]
MIEKEKRTNGFIKSAMILTISAIIAKIFGAIYRIPLTNMLGAYGIGVYQLIFPLYALLVTFAAAGIPTAVSKLVAEKTELHRYDEAKVYFKIALLFLTAIGLFLSLLLYGFAGVIGKLQQNLDTVIAYRLIAASILIECITAAFKGWFHGRMNMKPSAISQIAEQVTKMSMGLLFVYLSKPDIIKGVYAAVTAVTISEFMGLVVMAVMFIKQEKISIKSRMSLFKGLSNTIDTKHCISELFKYSIPLTISAAVLPVSHLIDSIMVQNLIDLSNKTELYGLWSGPVHSLLSMPSVLIMGIAASVVPEMAKSCAIGDKEGVRKNLNTAFALTFAIAIPAAIGLFLLSKEVGILLYPTLSQSDKNIFSKLLMMSAPSVVFMATLMTGTSVLQAHGKMYVPVVSLAIGTAIKCVADYFLYRNPNINIFGEGISNSLCYLIATTINLWYILYKLKLNINWWNICFKPLVAGTAMCATIIVMRIFLKTFVASKLGIIISIAFAAIVYSIGLIILWRINKQRLLKL